MCFVSFIFDILNLIIFPANYEIIMQIDITMLNQLSSNMNISNYSELDIASSMKSLPTSYMVFVYPYMYFCLLSQGGANIFFSVLYCYPCE